LVLVAEVDVSVESERVSVRVIPESVTAEPVTKEVEKG
jgi:hypothetical protein